METSHYKMQTSHYKMETSHNKMETSHNKMETSHNKMCYNCLDDSEDEQYTPSVFNKQILFCNECYIESEKDMRKAWAARLHGELTDVYDQREKYHHSICCNCLSDGDEKYGIMILWKRYAFCSEYCQYETERDLRKMWLRTKLCVPPPK